MNQKGDLLQGSSVPAKDLSPKKIKFSEHEKENHLQSSSQFMFQVVIEKEEQLSFNANNSHIYKLLVTDHTIHKTWTISRDYHDFAWLFTALKNSHPGYLFPYFSSSTIIAYLNTKLNYLNGREKNIYLASRLQELRLFLDHIVKSPIFGSSEELKMFVQESRDDFLSSKRHSEVWSDQLDQMGENRSKRVLALLEKGISWFSSKGQEEPVLDSKEWSEIKYDINLYSQQLYSLTQKLFLFKHSKEDEVNWKAPTTDIDEFERLRAKVLSGSPITQQLISQLESQILLPLVDECKKEGQLQKLLGEKEAIMHDLVYLRKQESHNDKLSKLQKRNQLFEANLMEEWPKFKSSWLGLMDKLDQTYSSLVENYSRQMLKLWK